MKQEDRPIIETASATTSPDNENSGPFAYIVFAITCGVVLVLSLVFAAIMGIALGFAAQQVSYGTATPLSPEGFDNLNDPYDFDDLDEFLEQYYDLFPDENMNLDEQERDDGKASVADALDFDLAPYTVRLESEVPASTYANTPQEVRDFTRSLIAIDTDYAQRVSRALDAAARDEEVRAQKLSEAHDACLEAKSVLDELAIPAFEGIEDTSVRDLLGSAKETEARRFTLIAEEIDLLAQDGSIDTKALWDKDDAVVEATEEAADHIIEALEASKAH